MANETLITDLVAQEALDQLEALNGAMEETYKTFADVGKELAKGLKIPVEVQGDLDKITQVYNTQMKNAAQTTQQLTQIQQQQQQVIANTTNTISRQLAEQEKLNKAHREAYTEQQRGLDIAKNVLGTHEQAGEDRNAGTTGQATGHPGDRFSHDTAINCDLHCAPRPPEN